MAHKQEPWIVEPVFIAQSDKEALHFGEYRFPFKRTEKGSSFTYSREEAEANARLMQAAPEMLEALYDARGWFPANGAGGNVRRKIDAVIAKAEGKQ